MQPSPGGRQTTNGSLSLSCLALHIRRPNDDAKHVLRSNHPAGTDCAGNSNERVAAWPRMGQGSACRKTWPQRHRPLSACSIASPRSPLPLLLSALARLVSCPRHPHLVRFFRTESDFSGQSPKFPDCDAPHTPRNELRCSCHPGCRRHGYPNAILQDSVFLPRKGCAGQGKATARK